LIFLSKTGKQKVDNKLPESKRIDKLKTSRLFEITCGDRGTTYYSKPTTRPPKKQSIQLESFNFVREHYINYKQTKSTFMEESKSSYAGTGSHFHKT